MIAVPWIGENIYEIVFHKLTLRDINFQRGNNNQAANLWILLKQKKRKNPTTYQIKMAGRQI